MTSIADQSVHQLGGAASVLVRQRHDHSKLDRYGEKPGTRPGRTAQESS